MFTMIQAQNHLNQKIPQSINFSEKSIPNISTITADESTRAMIVSPVSKTDILHRNQDRLITDTTAEKMVAQKQK